ncbi:YceI family protein [Pseudomarimonas arenosa]|uniref:YceI family protein n=1 Tax=Pseudomarimonas arenosa TaxID=2774145 RepID=A0AAW3ZTT3_9GAMM|nr:YceI family protein [Pseudomarimonas arenosa]MBD8528190.1 YceI family protein [Pseudomarimonas arenosa]
MRCPYRWLLGLLLACTALGSAQASELLGQIEPAFSRAEFSLRVLWVRKLEGRFEYIQGSISHPAQADRFDVDVRIAAQSLQMRNPDHVEWAKSEEFFDALRHPWIDFRARGAPRSLLTEGGELLGELSLRGVTRPARFTLLPAPCDRPGLDCAVQAQGEIERSEFGMTARRWAVSDKVKLAFSFRLKEPRDS